MTIRSHLEKLQQSSESNIKYELSTYWETNREYLLKECLAAIAEEIEKMKKDLKDIVGTDNNLSKIIYKEVYNQAITDVARLIKGGGK